MNYSVIKDNKEIGTVYALSLFMAKKKAIKLYGKDITLKEE